MFGYATMRQNWFNILFKNNWTFKLKNIFKRDLKKVIYHESGHLIMIKNFGGDGVVVIKPTYTEI
tara:strand:+ start:3196 stop:3390 length:195 start_codon:yes stop_codon:yes gene_type:complete